MPVSRPLLFLLAILVPLSFHHRLGAQESAPVPVPVPASAPSPEATQALAQRVTVTASGRHEIVADGFDLAAIANSLEALPPEGGTVFLPEGTYVLKGPVVMDRDNLTLKGSGPKTILLTMDGSDAPVIIMGSTETPVVRPTRNLTVCNLTLDGNRMMQKEECWTGKCDTGGLAYIRNNCLTVRGVEDSRISRVWATRGRSGGLVTEKGCRRLIVEDFVAWDNHFDGLACYETEESVFTGMHLHHNQFAAISLDINFHRNAIINSLLEHNGHQGIFMRDSSSNVFQNLVIRHNGGQGVFIAQVDDEAGKACRDNIFSGLRCEHMLNLAFRVNDASCTGNVLSNSVFAHNPKGDVSEVVPGLLLQQKVKVEPALP